MIRRSEKHLDARDVTDHLDINTYLRYVYVDSLNCNTRSYKCQAYTLYYIASLHA